MDTPPGTPQDLYYTEVKIIQKKHFRDRPDHYFIPVLGLLGSYMASTWLTIYFAIAMVLIMLQDFRTISIYHKFYKTHGERIGKAEEDDFSVFVDLISTAIATTCLIILSFAPFLFPNYVVDFGAPVVMLLVFYVMQESWCYKGKYL